MKKSINSEVRLPAHSVPTILSSFEKIQASHAMGEQSIEWRKISRAYVANPKFSMKPGKDHFDYEPTEKAYSDYLSNWKKFYNKEWDDLKWLAGNIGQPPCIGDNNVRWAF